MLVSLTVGKVDAGVAVLLTEDKRLIEFPSILLPSSIASGSIVDITVKQNFEAEQKTQAAFAALQNQILTTYGINTPTTPVLRLRNATQTSLVLEWDPIQLATTTLRSLSLYRNGSKAGNIPRPLEQQATKISGLAVDTEYSFYLVLRTSGGTFTSNTLTVKTHSMNNLTGITVTPGVLPPPLRESLETAVERIGAKLIDSVRIDTTHFVCTEGRGRDWERANEMNIPVVRPEWIEGCEREGRIIGVRGYYLDADPKQRQVGSNPSLAGRPGNGTAATPSEQANIPQRPKEPQTPKSPDRESTVSGEPGPEVPPTPPRKDVPPPGTEDDEEEEDEEEDEDPQATEEAERPPAEVEAKQRAEESEEDEDESTTEEPTRDSEDHNRQTEVEESKETADMEDVAL
ncbi:Chitin synthase, class 5 [Elasticomyces elasticus]|uniref:Chitin synthase, class 5 n=1 Tax=Exophiala sideris TaxID=1016849 RepID=A0ABR0JP91_9EURO|nr:Chitin synthase, class 5 [Elasticomyces elasticus]KAK5024209.1 Chitin synthase, class 5 [Exophiala sideris]KAK5036712.1 Chitin synthase, class 5 [Exophiala sideris]KAK5067096.1 Chitin synthase, class 5 [Exophiala sideris]KAK5186730.1 Chitin synthase, class 5 [Eurotiomycetes sp. CCFEE 6388]